MDGNTAGLALGDGAVVMLADAGDLGVEELRRALPCCPGVDPGLVPEGCVENHYRWIVWLRYDRELDRGERSVLRRVLERDESAGVPMVLCVAEVRPASLLLTDGWYSLPCPLERGSPLLRLVQRGLLPEGTKLVTQGAELLGGEAGCHPLEAILTHD